jgi:Ca2+-binding RTX toxin-like protein
LAQTAGATSTIHLRYFESAYTLLYQSPYQLYSFVPLEGEKITLVAYGLNPDEGVQPALLVIDPNGATLAEELNSDGDSVAVLEFVAPMNGLYLIALTRLGPQEGAMRLMLFEGDPIDFDITLLDTAAPVLPDRAFLIAGDAADPITLSTDILQADPDRPNQFFASRANETQAAPPDERNTPVEGARWVNAEGEIFYALNIAANPEQLPSVDHEQTLASLQSPTNTFFDFTVQVRRGSDPVRVTRPVCLQTTASSTTARAAPTTAAFITGQLGANQTVEVIALDPSQQWVQIIDTARPGGFAWIPRATAFNLDQDACGRVVVNNSAQADWGIMQANYNQALQNPQGAIVSLEFDCQNQDAFVSAYEAIQNNVGGWLPILDFLLGQLNQLSCTPTASSPPPPSDGGTSPGPGPSTGEGGGNDSGSTSTDPCPNGSTVTTFLVGNLFGGTPNHFTDNFTGTVACDVVYGNNNPNVLQGSDGDDTLIAYGGNDVLRGGLGNDALNGGLGDDMLRGGAGNDIADGGPGVDVYDASDLVANQSISLGGGIAYSGSDVDILLNMESIISGPGDDSLFGNSGPNRIEGGGGSDTLQGGGGTDLLEGQSGNDLFILSGAMGNSSLSGGSGADTYRIKADASGDVSINTDGFDTIDFSDWGSGIVFDMSLTTPQNLGPLIITLMNAIQGLFATPFDDTITGSTGNDIIHGLAGNDSLSSLGGNDTLYGGDGSDSLEGGNDNDYLYGGWDNQGLSRNDSGNDNLRGGMGNDVIYGGNHNQGGAAGSDGDDQITDVGGSDIIFGGNYNEGSSSGCDGSDIILDVTGDNDLLYGGNFNLLGTGCDGDDTITDLAGNTDTLHGGNQNLAGSSGHDGNDSLTDNAGNNDNLVGGNYNAAGASGNDGNDTLTDSGGADSIVGGNYNVAGASGNDGDDTLNVNDGAIDLSLHGDNFGGGGTGGTDVCNKDALDPVPVDCP